MSTTTISVRLDKSTKTNAEKLFEELGLNMSTAITLFIKQSLRERSIPFSITENVPNADTLSAMKEAEELLKNPNTKRFSSIAALRKDLGV